MRLVLAVFLLFVAGCPEDIPADSPTPETDWNVLVGEGWEAHTRVFRCDAPPDGVADLLPLFGEGDSFGVRRDAFRASYLGSGPPVPSTYRSTPSTLPSALSAWCFDANPASPPGPDAAVQRDHFAVRAMALPSATTSAFFALDANLTESMVGQFRVTSDFTAEQGPRARLAIIDTSPDDGHLMGSRVPGSRDFRPLDRDAKSEHGSALANVAAQLACGDKDHPPSDGLTNCAVDIHTRLALGEVVGEPLGDPPGSAGYVLTWSDDGGLVGTVAGLAAAITDEVNAYKVETERGDAVGLVLNISAGFGNEWVGTTPTDAARALEDALLYARCSGALIFAAEGGAVTPGAPSGMLVPARWHGVTNLDGEPYSCDGRVTGEVRWDASSPLVYPVGSLGSGTASFPVGALASAPWARTRAFGGPASAFLPDFVLDAPTHSPPPKDEYSLSVAGSSVPTVIVSTIAAIKWGKGETTSCLGGWPSAASSPLRVGSTSPILATSVYEAVARGCNVTAGLVDPVVSSKTATVAAVTLSRPLVACSQEVTDYCVETVSAAATAPALTPVTPSTCANFAGKPARAGCKMAVAWDCGSNSVTSCPATDLYSTSAQPWVVGQPPPPFCPACAFDINGRTLYTEYPPSFDNSGAVVAGTLVLLTPGMGGKLTPSTQFLDLDIQRDTPTTITFPTGVALGTPVAAYLSIVRTQNGTTTAQSCPVRLLNP